MYIHRNVQVTCTWRKVSFIWTAEEEKKIYNQNHQRQFRVERKGDKKSFIEWMSADLFLNSTALSSISSISPWSMVVTNEWTIKCPLDFEAHKARLYVNLLVFFFRAQRTVRSGSCFRRETSRCPTSPQNKSEGDLEWTNDKQKV